MKRQLELLGLGLLLIASLAGCARSETPTPQPATATPLQTAAPSETPTPLPSRTPAPSPTPVPLEVQLERGLALDSLLPQSAFTLRFNQPMNAAGVGLPLLVSPFLEGEHQWDETQTVLTFVPDDTFLPGRTYLLVVSEELESAAGQSFSEVQQWEIEVLAAPTVANPSPAAGLLGERRPTIQVAFDQVMDRNSVAAALSVEPPVPLNLAWQENTLAITPEEPLEPGETYRFALDPAAASRHGVGLGDEYRWTYWLDDLIRYVSNPTENDRHAPITIGFNYEMDRDSVRRALGIEPAIGGGFEWSDDGKVATLTPADPLPSGTEYTMSFDGLLLDAHGDAVGPPGPISFTTPPPIVSATPQGTDVPPAGVIQVVFDRPMDGEATAAAFSIRPEVAGRLEWSAVSFTFRPDSGYLDENSVYTVTIGTAARDADGNPILDEPYSWSFLTDMLQDVASFGWGPNAQIVDADGRRAIQFQLYQKDPTKLSFDLYRLSLTQFLDRYSSGFRGVAGWEDRPISTEGAALAASWQIEAIYRATGSGYVQEVVLPADVPAGLYLLNLTAGHVNGQLLLVVTRNTLMVNQAEGQLVVWVSDINGGPVSDLDVRVYARDGELIASGRADENGIYQTEVDRDPQPLIVVAREGDDITASGLSNEWRTGDAGWYGWWQPDPTGQQYAVHVYTDRPIYRPGQTLFFKAIIRQDDDAMLDLIPAGAPVTARIRDARNNVVQTFELTSNAFGTVNGAFQLAEGAMLGSYGVEILLEGESHRQTFKVEDYRKPDYQVSVVTDAERYVVGDEVQVTVDSSYFFGEPVPNADLVIQQFVLGETYWWMELEDEYLWYAGHASPIRARTDAEGRFALMLGAELGYYGRQVDWQSNLQRAMWAVEVTVDDGSHQTVSGFAVYHVFSAAERIRLDTGGYVHQPGRSFPVEVEVLTIDDQAVGGRALDLELLRYSRESREYSIVIQSIDVTTGADGRARVPLTIAEPGYYRLALTGTDRWGNKLEWTSWVYAYDEFFGRWYGRDSDLSIDAERDSYEPGDTARLLIESSFSGPALLTFERGATRRQQLIELTAPLTLVEASIQADDAPNVFVAVYAWREEETSIGEYTWESMPGSRLHTASVELVVPVTGKELNVTISPDNKTYAPRAEAVVTVRVTNARGDPVSAEVSLAMVDEAIFALSDDLSGPIFDAFYHRRERVVRSYNSMAPIRDLGGRGLGGGGNGGDMAGNPRSDFPDTAEWFPVLHTDANGEATVTFALPDSLTSWRLTAKATTADTQVGETFVSVTCRQEIVVRPILPRVLTAGDQVELFAIVHNYGDTRQEIDVSMHLPEAYLTAAGPITQTISLAPGELGIVGWRAMPVQAGEAEITVRADVGEETRDAVLLTLPIRPLAVPDVTSQVGQFSGELATAILMPEEALGMSSVRIELSRSIAGSLLEGLDYLTGFPYGCVEQTMSRALPNAVVGRALYQLGVGDPTLLADLPPKINAGLQRLYGYQHNDGGWGWWYDDNTDGYQTAWVVFGLAVTAEAGYQVDPDVIQRGVDWLGENLDDMDLRSRAYALYSMAMAGGGDLVAAQALAEKAGELDTFSQAALALALHRLGAEAGARRVLDYLVETAVIHDDMVTWSGADYDGHYYQKTMASATRSTALALSAFVQISPDHELETGMVRWLMGQRRQQGWGSTNETSFALLALTDHLLATQEASAETGYQVELNGEMIAAGTLGPGEPAVSLEITAGEMVSGLNSLHIRQTAGGRLYYVISSRVYLAQEQIEPAGVIEVSRSYLDLGSGEAITTAEPGQLIRVSLVVTMEERGSYIIVEDNLPGGLEALNERLNTTSHVGSTLDEPRYYWMDYGYNHKEVYGDRVIFFITELEEGRHVYTYVARATHAGEFVALPAEVSAMYDLTTWGRSASAALAVAVPEME